MDALTRQVRRSHWLQIIEACSNRPKGTTTKQWCQDHDIDRRQLYYWLKKFRSEAAAEIESAVSAKTVVPPIPVSAGFADITDLLGFTNSGKQETDAGVCPLVPELMIQADDLRIYVSGAIQQRTLETVMQVIRRA